MGLFFNKKTGQYEDDTNPVVNQYLAMNRKQSGASGSWGDPEAPSPKEVDPIVKEHLMKKLASASPERAPAIEDIIKPEGPKEPSLYDKYKSDFGDENYKKAQAEAEEGKEGLGWAQFAAGLGDALAGRDSSQTAKNFDSIRKGIDEKTIGAFEKRKQSALQDISTKKSLEGGDPNSEKSKSFRKAIEANFPNIAKQYGDAWQNVTADDQENIFKPLQLRENIEARKQTAAILAQNNAQARQDKLEEKREKASKLSDKQIEAFADLENAESDLNNLLGSLGNKSNWTGPVDGRVPDMFVGDDQVAWRSAVGKYKDAYRKAVTGAGAGPTEIAMLEKRLPSELDTLANFQAKSKEALKELQRRKQVLAQNLEKGGKNVAQFQSKPTTNQDEQAVQWALSNPNDPRAAKILEKNGVKIGGR